MQQAECLLRVLTEPSVQPFGNGGVTDRRRGAVKPLTW
jgi:hypothetical protein